MLFKNKFFLKENSCTSFLVEAIHSPIPWYHVSTTPSQKQKTTLELMLALRKVSHNSEVFLNGYFLNGGGGVHLILGIYGLRPILFSTKIFQKPPHKSLY